MPFAFCTREKRAWLEFAKRKTMVLLGAFHGDGRAIDVLGWIERQGGRIRERP